MFSENISPGVGVEVRESNSRVPVTQGRNTPIDAKGERDNNQLR